MNGLQQRKLTRQEPDSNPNARLLGNMRTGSLIAYRVIRERLRERDIRGRDIGERDIGERDIQERDIRERDIQERDIREREGHRGDCRHLTIRRVAAAPHRHSRCFRLPELLTELAPLGEVFAALQAPKTPAH